MFGTTSQVAPTIDGFIISGGGGGNHGGGISMRDSDATISNNIITGNIGYLLGGGIYVQRGTPRIQYNRIQNNTADGQNNFALRAAGSKWKRQRVLCAATSSPTIHSLAVEQ